MICRQANNFSNIRNSPLFYVLLKNKHHLLHDWILPTYTPRTPRRHTFHLFLFHLHYPQTSKPLSKQRKQTKYTHYRKNNSSYKGPYSNKNLNPPEATMSVWSQFLLQERIRIRIELLSLFHDYSLAIITMVLIFVTGISLSIISNKFISDFVIITTIEVIWTVVPVIILLFLAIPSLRVLYHIDDTDPYLTLKVVGRQWYWRYELIDLDLEFDSYILPNPALGEFRLLDVDHRVILPVGKNIRGLVTGGDVIHCWALPAIGVKADAVPGRLNQVRFNSIRSGVTYGQCSEICGANHRFIPIVVETLSPSIFLDWCNNLCVG